MSKYINLTKNKVTIVDDEYYEHLNQFKWKYDNKGYAVRAITILPAKDGKRFRKLIGMHRVVINAPDGTDVDHINGNGLDNRRCNLRLCTSSENSKNRKKSIGMTSRYKGVCWRKEYKKWRASIYVNEKQIELGTFSSEVEAALVYNKAALKYYGEFAKINQVIYA